MAQRPPPTAGMCHVALFVADLEASERFYVDLVGMTVEWRPDSANVYLTSGNDNLALHHSRHAPDGPQRLDHIGFLLNHATDVDLWYDHLKVNGAVMKTAPRTHRDGARSFYCEDPSGISVQFIHHPPIAGK